MFCSSCQRSYESIVTDEKLFAIPRVFSSLCFQKRASFGYNINHKQRKSLLRANSAAHLHKENTCFPFLQNKTWSQVQSKKKKRKRKVG